MDNYFYINSKGEQVGPRTIQQMREENVLHPHTMIWKPGYSDWKKVADAEELADVFAAGDTQPKMPPRPDIDLPPTSNINNAYHSNSEPKHNTQNYSNYNVQQEQIVKKPYSWLVESILCALFCCQVTGIIAIIYAAKVDSNWKLGNFQESQDASKIAKRLVIASVAIGIIFGILYLAINGLAVFSAMSNSTMVDFNI